MNWLRDLIHDLRRAARNLTKTPGFAAVAILSLSLGVGANTAIFSIMNGIMLRALPVPDPQQLQLVSWSGANVSLNNYTGSTHDNGGRTEATAFSHPVYRDLRDRCAGIAELFAFFPLYNQTAQTGDQVGVSDGMMVSGNFFHGYGAHALIGRTLTPDDDRAGADPAAVITHRLWEQRFAMDPKAIGQTLAVNRNKFTIVGVLPKSYAGPQIGDSADFYVPLAAQPQLMPYFKLASFNHWWVLAMARLAPGASPEQLHSTLNAAFINSLKRSTTKAENPAIDLTAGARGMVAAEPSLAYAFFALQGVVAVILMIACANLAGLMLARGESRRREFAVCAAMGAGRGRLVRQMLAESLLLAGAGGAAGVASSVWIKAALLRFVPEQGFSFNLDTRLDGRVLLFTSAGVLLTAVLCGILPAWSASRVDPAADLKSGRDGGLGRQRLGRGLVAMQAALSLLLVAAAGLFLRSMDNLRAIEPGFDPQNLLLFRLGADQAGLSEAQRFAFFERAREALAGIPGVKAVAAADLRLVAGSVNTNGYSIPGRDADGSYEHSAHTLTVADGFFKAMGIALKQGREFEPADASQRDMMAVVNERFAAISFPGENPVGRTLNMDGKDFRIIGVCASTLYSDVKDEKPATVYFSARQRIPSDMEFAVRSVLPPASIISAARRAVAEIDPSIPLADVTTQEAEFDRSLLLDRTFSALCGSLAALALLLSCIGIYGLLAYSVARRTAEIGLRAALGAQPSEVAFAVVRDGLKVMAWGLGSGIPLAIGLGYVARDAFYGVAPYDPAAICGAAGILLAVAVVAAWLPARRAARVDPMTALRAE